MVEPGDIKSWVSHDLLTTCASVEPVSELDYCQIGMTAIVMGDVNAVYTLECAHRRHMLAARALSTWQEVPAIANGAKEIMCAAPKSCTLSVVGPQGNDATSLCQRKAHSEASNVSQSPSKTHTSACTHRHTDVMCVFSLSGHSHTHRFFKRKRATLSRHRSV